MPSSIGSALSGLGSSIGGLFGGGGGSAAAGIPAQAAEAAASLPTSVPSLPAGWDPSQPAPGVGWGTSTGLGPTAYDPTTATSFPPTSIVPADGGAAPAPTATDPMASLASGLASAYANPANAAAINAAARGTSAAPTDWMTTLGNWLKGDVSGAKGALGSPISALGTLGNVIEAYNRWQTMKTLQNPAALASGASQLYQPMSKALKRNIIAPVTAAAQETGQINAPGLYSQSVASALAPYQYQMQMNALKDYIEALQASGGAYPQGGMFGGGLVPQGIYGGSGTTTAAGA